MKYPFNISIKASFLASLLFGFMLPSITNAAVTGPVTLATSPLANSTTLFVKPNLMFIFDDSTSMDADSIPDLAASSGSYSADYYFRNAAFNGMAYDPAVTFSPPTYFTAAGVLDTATYPTQTGTSTATGQSSTPTPNWKGVRSNAYVSGGTTNIEAGAYFYTAIPGEFCKELDYKECIAATAESVTYPFPAPLRWCRTDALAKQLATPTELTAGVASSATAPSCQAANDTNHNFPRFPSPRRTTITISAATGAVVTGITVGTQQILSASTTSSSSTSTVAGYIRDNINKCTSVSTGNCNVTGYAALVSGSVVTIVAPTNTALAAPVVAKTGTLTFSPAIPAFTTAISGSSVPGKNLLTVISTGNVYSYPGSATVSPDRTDCSGTCTYAKEMENYANWYTYYRVRLQAMQTSVSRAFKNVDNRFRIGFSTINDATVADGTEFLVPKTFETANKKGWYDKLFSIDNANLNGSTPNRFALAKIGNFYANKVAGQTFDPIQYSCQQNFAILSTDGFWNKFGAEAGTFTPKKPDGTAVGDQDNGTSVPLKYRQGPTAVSNSLADVAKFFYETDLRSAALNNCTSGSGTGETLCETTVPTPLAYDKYGNKLDKYSNVFKGGDDDNPSQHMTTFTMAFGLQDKLTYEPNYDNAGKGDFNRLKNGTTPTTQWTNPDIANTGITVPGRVDDLWHAAVSGRGKYFSADKPEDVVAGFVDLLTSITTTLGAGAAAATSTLNPVAGDDSAYVASYTTGEWTGNLESRAINLTTGAVNTTPRWCVEDVGTCVGKLTPQALADTRKIWTKGSNSSTLNNFKITGGDLNATDFDSTKLSGLSQWSSLGGTKQTAAVANIIDYLRGKKDKEFSVTDSNDRLFRTRQATLGDAINSQPAFIGKSTFSYTDTGYSTYKAGTITRAKTVYMGTNDGMMHAFNANANTDGTPNSTTGNERWAYVPSMVIPNMWKLADNNYNVNHAYFADGSPVVSDVYYGGSWKTILVAGLNGGGKGYYALDITNPDAPTLLWEFTPADDAAGQDLGFSYGKPVITKRSDGKWVVLVTSGYNNTTGTNKGRGFLYVLDAQPDASGNVQILKKIGTGEGTLAIPSGLAQIAAWVDSAEKNNTATFIYGGDLLGNLWRFDIRVGFETAHKFASLSGQPITTKPELGLVLSTSGTTHRVVFVGTGKYLETTDLTDNSQQTLYSIKDDDVLGSGSITPTLVNPRGTGATNGTVAGNDRMVVQTLSSASGNSRTVTSNNAVDFSKDRGWFIDLASGERQNVASQLVLGTLIVPTTVPETSACRPGGKGWLNFFDYKSGRAVSGNTQVSTATNAPIVGINVIYIPDPANPGKTKAVGSAVTADDPTPKPLSIPFSGAGSGLQKKRVMWREIVKP